MARAHNSISGNRITKPDNQFNPEASHFGVHAGPSCSRTAPRQPAQRDPYAFHLFGRWIRRHGHIIILVDPEHSLHRSASLWIDIHEAFAIPRKIRSPSGVDHIVCCPSIASAISCSTPKAYGLGLLTARKVGTRRTKPASVPRHTRRCQHDGGPLPRAGRPNRPAPSGRGRPWGALPAMLRMHHARLRLTPSKCTSCRSAAVCHLGRREQRFGFTAGHARKEPPQPDAELGRRQHPPHQVRLHQAGRKEVRATRFPGRRNPNIGGEIEPAPLFDQLPRGLWPAARA